MSKETITVMHGIAGEIKLRHVGNCMQADPACGVGVVKALGVSPEKVGKKEK